MSVVDYETFWTHDLQGRLRLFNSISDENKADLVRTHVERWRDANRDRLTPEQLAMIEENISYVTPGLYRSKTQAQLNLARDLERRNAALFSHEEMRQFLTIYGNDG